MISLISLLLIFVGLVIMVIGSYGIAKFPDIYSRLQASSAADTVAAMVVLTGLLLRSRELFEGLKIGSLILFLFLTGPIITHSIARAAFLSKREPHQGESSSDRRKQ